MCSRFKDYYFSIIYNPFSLIHSLDSIFWTYITWVAPRLSRTEKQYGDFVNLHNETI